MACMHCGHDNILPDGCCYKCGEKTITKRRVPWLPIGAAFALGIAAAVSAVLIIGATRDAGGEQSLNEAGVEKYLRTVALDPGSVQDVKCGERKGAVVVCDYRAKNGFGALTVGKTRFTTFAGVVLSAYDL